MFYKSAVITNNLLPFKDMKQQQTVIYTKLNHNTAYQILWCKMQKQKTVYMGKQ